MSSTKKLFAVVILFFLPLTVLTIFYQFGENVYKLPVYFAEDSVKNDKGFYTITKAHVVPDFNFISHLGNPISNKQYENKILVVDFFFTRCGSICPQMTNQLTRVQEEFIDNDQIQLLSLTVDPKHDSVEVLSRYAQEYGTQPSKWLFATGEKEYIYKLAQKGMFITALEDTARPLDFIHSDKFVLIDKKGWIRGYYNGTDEDEVKRLITEINVLLEIENNNDNRK